MADEARRGATPRADKSRRLLQLWVSAVADCRGATPARGPAAADETTSAEETMSGWVDAHGTTRDDAVKKIFLPSSEMFGGECAARCAPWSEGKEGGAKGQG